jgi:hypothetical protein
MARYIVSWVPTTSVEKACRRLGMKDGDDTSFWDWIEPEDCQNQIAAKTFAEAVRDAGRVVLRDVFGEVRIERQNLVQNHDDLGNVYSGKSWETDAVWNVQDGDAPDESDPDYTPEA